MVLRSPGFQAPGRGGRYAVAVRLVLCYALLSWGRNVWVPNRRKYSISSGGLFYGVYGHGFMHNDFSEELEGRVGIYTPEHYDKITLRAFVRSLTVFTELTDVSNYSRLLFRVWADPTVSGFDYVSSASPQHRSWHRFRHQHRYRYRLPSLQDLSPIPFACMRRWLSAYHFSLAARPLSSSRSLQPATGFGESPSTDSLTSVGMELLVSGISLMMSSLFLTNPRIIVYVVQHHHPPRQPLIHPSSWNYHSPQTSQQKLPIRLVGSVYSVVASHPTLRWLRPTCDFAVAGNGVRFRA